ncbi:protein FAM168A isoform X3 [Lagenorhynchus albirostris]|uniref:protein FAM168A isoform X3 n=1 Tax=Lagenorhynchus albirostris TaxID=27610 RepID=UPI0028E6DF61|nr:protein FAM168A isoform X3 [Lagenorhynchus albirostris]
MRSLLLIRVETYGISLPSLCPSHCQGSPVCPWRWQTGQVLGYLVPFMATVKEPHSRRVLAALKEEKIRKPLGQKDLRGYLAVPRRAKPSSILNPEPGVEGPPSWLSREMQHCQVTPTLHLRGGPGTHSWAWEVAVGTWTKVCDTECPPCGQHCALCFATHNPHSRMGEQVMLCLLGPQRCPPFPAHLRSPRERSLCPKRGNLPAWFSCTPTPASMLPCCVMLGCPMPWDVTC